MQSIEYWVNKNPRYFDWYRGFNLLLTSDFLQLGNHQGELPLLIQWYQIMRTQLLGHYGSERHHTQELVEMVNHGRLKLSDSVTQVLSLDQAALALETLEKKIGNPIRIVLKP